jgi:hypothetical protein
MVVAAIVSVPLLLIVLPVLMSDRRKRR